MQKERVIEKIKGKMKNFKTMFEENSFFIL